MKSHFVELPVSTRAGRFVARYSEKAWPNSIFLHGRDGYVSHISPGRTCQSATPTSSPDPKIRDWHRVTEAALKKILAGSEPKTFPPLDLAGTEFQKNVWNALRKISLGTTKSYSEIAQAIGRPKAVRAVGGACGANPVPVLVPCHRVLAANSKFGGFSGGLDWKRVLLAREGVWFRQNASRRSAP